MSSCPVLNVNLDIVVLVLVSIIKSNFLVVLFLSTIGLGYIDSSKLISYISVRYEFNIMDHLLS